MPNNTINEEVEDVQISTFNYTTKCGKKYEVENINEKDSETCKQWYPKVKKIFQVNGFIQNENFLNNYQDLLNIKLRDDDIWICSFPRSGTTWTAEMVWCIMNNFDFDAARKTDVASRVPMIEACLGRFINMIPHFFNEGETFPNLQSAHEMPSPRIFSSHLPFIFLPLELQNRETNTKVIYCHRNPKDVCLSSYHHFKSLIGYPCTFDEYCEMFLNQNNIVWGPYWKHLDSYLKEKDNPNVYFTGYEEKIKDLKSVIKNIAKFLNKRIIDEEINELYDHLQFEKMKANPQLNMRERYKTTFPNSYQNIEHIRDGKMKQGELAMNPYYKKKFDERMSSYEMKFI